MINFNLLNSLNQSIATGPTMRKRVLLLATSCRNGGLCPGGIDLDDMSSWIRIVNDDGCSGSVQGHDIDFAEPLDVIEFQGRYAPQGKQIENWVIVNRSCKNKGRFVMENGSRSEKDILDFVYKNYGYHGYWGNYRAYLKEEEFERVSEPSETILKVSEVRVYRNHNNKAKIDFNWSRSNYRLLGVSVTDQDFYDKIETGDVEIKDAYIVISIPKKIDDWINPNTGEKQAYKFVSRIYDVSE